MNLRRLICWLRGRHIIVSRVETISGRPVHTQDYCQTCGKSTDRWPGGLLKRWEEAYKQLPEEYPDLFKKD